MNKPGQCVSVDQLESRHTPTRDRYTTATIFADHYSNYTFIHLQRSTGTNDTIIAKREFERQVRLMGVTIAQYHLDNGRFADTLW
jgi:hypothetical protein